MLSGDCNKNSQNNSVGLISEKTTLHVQHTFFLISEKTTLHVQHTFLYISLHDFNVKLPELKLPS